MQNAHPYRPTGVGGSLNAHWRLVNVRPYSLVRLKHTINPMFPAGTIVALSDRIEVRQAPPTPTKYEGQGKPNPDANASVKIYLWRQKTTFTTALSRDGGNSLSIPHKYLVDPTTGRTGPRGGWKNEAQVKLAVPASEETSYMTEAINLPNIPRVSVPIPPGTIGVVRKCMTRTSQPRTQQQALTSHRTDWFYVMAVDARVTTWEWVPCQDFVNVLNLEPLQPQESVLHTNFIKSKTGQVDVFILPVKSSI